MAGKNQVTTDEIRQDREVAGDRLRKRWEGLVEREHHESGRNALQSQKSGTNHQGVSQ